MSDPKEKLLSRLRGMKQADAQEAALNLLRFMFSDDDGEWDQAAADEFLAELEKERDK